MKKKKYEILLSILTISSVLIAAVGATFAYFSTDISGTPGKTEVNTALVGGVTFDGGADFSDANEIEPNWSASKTFSVTAAPSDFNQTVKVIFKYTNGFTDLKCNVTSEETNSGAKGDVTLITNETVEQEATLVEVTFPPSTEAKTIQYTLFMEFPDTGENQNAQQGKEFNGTLIATLAGGNTELYYNASNPDGVSNPPN